MASLTKYLAVLGLYTTQACASGAAGSTPSADANTVAPEPSPTAVASTLPPPPHDANSIDQVNVNSGACPQPANANDFFGLPRCCNTAAVVCDDFESVATGANPNSTLWAVQLNSPNDILEVSDAYAARGSQSLHIRVPNVNGERAVIVNTSLFPAPQGAFFGRAFLYFDAQVPNNHTTYIAAGPNPQTGYEWIRYSTFSSGHLGANDSGPDNSSITAFPLPTNQWACLEWQFDAVNQVANYWLNGQAITTFKFRTSNITWGQVFLGWEIYTHDGSQAFWDMYYDEIALDYKRIGCAN